MGAVPTIVVVTTTKINFSPKDILKRLGIEAHIETICDDKNKKVIKNFNFDHYKSEKYLAFFVGGIPHKTTASGKNSSMLSEDTTSYGQPIIRCHSLSNNQPKLTKSSFEQAVLQNKTRLIKK